MKIENLKTENLRFTDFETKRNKSGGKFQVMKVYTQDPSGRNRPIILGKKDVTTLGLKKVVKEDGSLSHFYFPMICGPNTVNEAWIEKFNEISDCVETACC